MFKLINNGYSSNLKLATVVDIILNYDHPYFNPKENINIAKELKTVNSDQLPIGYNNLPANNNDIDYSFIGRAKVRIIDEENRIDESRLRWAIPLNSCITQYPLLNECVLIIEIGKDLYYTNPFNYYNFTAVNASFNIESGLNIKSTSAVPSSYKIALKNNDTESINKFKLKQSYIAPPSITSVFRSGYLGENYIFNPYIRTLYKNEGDTIIESRFGQSIRFSAYDNTNNDTDNKGESRKDLSYNLNRNILSKSANGGFGNPLITIRNRQRNLGLKNAPQKLHPKLPEIPPITDPEKYYGGQIVEDINNDGSTIELNSGIRKSKWVTTCYKSMFGITLNNDPTEEQPNFNPINSTKFIFPELDGDQIVINTDRLILSSRFGETFHYSKKRYGIVTDNEYTVDANDQIVITTNGITCINSPQIFLGQYGETNEPAVLGQTAVDWLYDLCNWLLNHVHWYHHVHPYPHSHPDAGRETPSNTIDASAEQTQAPVQQIKLKLLRDNLHKLLSRRVFLVGGGYACGSDGVLPANSNGECQLPVKINTVTGDGVIGSFYGKNRRENPKIKTFK